MDGNIHQTDRRFQPDLNIRDFTSMAKRFKEPPTGPAWALVAPRRYGKTWALAGIKDLLGVDATKPFLPGEVSSVPPKARVILIDEPATDISWLASWLQKWKKAGKSTVIAMSPGEWEEFSRPDSAFPLHTRDLNEIEPLKPDELAKLTARTGWAAATAHLLPPDWKRSAFLAELILSRAEETPAHCANAEELAWAADLVERRGYVRDVYLKGLSEKQRSCLRMVRCKRTAGSDAAAAHLTRLGLLICEASSYRIADPVLARHLPPPFRIHHVSDVHFGPKAALLGGESRPSGTHRRIDGAVRESALVADSYVESLRSRPEGDRPHVVVVSGDLAETGAVTEFEQAVAWLDQVANATTGHERAGSVGPRVLVTGGNHDVDWTKALSGIDAQRRHEAFATRFARFEAPPLHEDPRSRTLRVVRFEEANVEFVLLGSAQLGGEPDDRDFERLYLISEVERLRSGLTGALNDADRDAIRSQIARVDSGLVHSADLVRLGQQRRGCALRIAVLHHPISPMPTGGIGGAAVIANAGAVKEAFLKGEVHIVMHGHQHTSLVMREEWPLRHSRRALWILAAPSLGSREVQEKHGFHEIEILREMDGEGVFFQVTIQPYAHEGGTWRAHGSQASFAVREDGSFGK